MENQGTSRNHKNEQDHTHDFWWWLNTVLHTDHPQTVLEDHKAQELRGLHSGRTWNFFHWEKQLPNSASFVCQWKLRSDWLVTKYRERLFRNSAYKTRGKMWGGRDAFCSIALPHLLCLLESPNTQRILHVSGTYYLHLHLLKSCIVAQRG